MVTTGLQTIKSNQNYQKYATYFFHSYATHIYSAAWRNNNG
jgi:hypothetical protein